MYVCVYIIKSVERKIHNMREIAACEKFSKV